MKRILIVLLALLIVFATGLCSLSAFGLYADEAEAVVTADENLVMANRFQNMLNNNYAYGDEFMSVDKILLASQLSLLDESKDGKIANADIIAFAKDMYGIDATVFADEGSQPLSADGVTEILPRGYSIFVHRVEEVIENEDGTYTVFSVVSTEDHDGNITEYESVSSFAKSEGSRFGYILISSELFEAADSQSAFIM